jgi:hypothetical protein
MTDQKCKCKGVRMYTTKQDKKGKVIPMLN